METKNKIIQIATELFGKNGFSGTSVRDIATKADVNIAAVNYHFTNKEGLYWEIIFVCYNKMDGYITEAAKKADNLEDLACNVFDIMYSQPDFLRNTFKLFLLENVSFPVDDERFKEMMTNHNPPGTQAIVELATKEMGDAINEASNHWLVTSIISYAAHWALKANSNYAVNTKNPNLTPEKLRNNLMHQVRSMLHYIKSKPDAFDNSFKS